MGLLGMLKNLFRNPQAGNTMMKIYLHKAADNYSLERESGERISFVDLLHLFEPRRVFALIGDLGSGKTTFTRSLCSELGIEDVVNSPTFAIVNVYELPDKKPFYHFDCYRIKSVGEALNIGAEEYIYSGDYCLIEWPEVIQSLLPDDTVYIRFCVLEDGTRELIIDA